MIRPSVIALCALLGSAAFMADVAAQGGAAKQPGADGDSAPGSIAAEIESNPCAAPRPPAATDDTGQSRTNLDAMRACAENLSARGQRLLQGEGEGEFDVFNRDLRNLIEDFQTEIRTVTGPGGVLEVLKRVQKQKERELTAATAKSAEPAADPIVMKLKEQADSFSEDIKRVEASVGGINDVLLSINASRPEIARVLRNKEFDALHTDLRGYITILEKTQEDLQNMRIDPNNSPETSN